MNGLISFKKPEYKKKYYIAHTEKPINYNLTDVTIKQMLKLKNDKGYMLTVNCTNSSDHKEFFNNIDDACIKQLIENNSTWFDNDLTQENIKTMFNPSYCLQNNIVSIFLPNGLNIEDIRDTSRKILNLKIQHIGMYIYSDQTINRWAVKAINIHNIEDVYMTESKEDIEAYWDQRVKQSIAALDIKISNIRETQDKLNELYSSIITEKFSNKEWEYKIRDLQTLIQNIIF